MYYFSWSSHKYVASEICVQIFTYFYVHIQNMKNIYIIFQIFCFYNQLLSIIIQRFFHITLLIKFPCWIITGAYLQRKSWENTSHSFQHDNAFIHSYYSDPTLYFSSNTLPYSFPTGSNLFIPKTFLALRSLGDSNENLPSSFLDLPYISNLISSKFSHQASYRHSTVQAFKISNLLPK